MRKVLASLLALLMGALPCVAQQSSSAPSHPLVIPAGTNLSVVLTQQIASGDTHAGDTLHAQVVSPAVSGSQVAIPAGTYLEGRIAMVSQRNDRVQVVLHFATLAFADGYAAKIPGTVTVQSAIGWWLPSPNSHRAAALIPLLLAPGIGAGIGAAVGKDPVLTPGVISGGQIVPGSMTSSTRGRDAAIGLAVGAGIAALGTVIYVKARHNGAPDFFFAAGTPMDATLVNDLSIDPVQADRAANAAPPSITPVNPPPAQSSPYVAPDSTPDGICYGPDTPGTPPTVIPGTPATPDSPGVPDIVIPGTPSTPGPIVPCS
jgi:hypothetical protein